MLKPVSLLFGTVGMQIENRNAHEGQILQRELRNPAVISPTSQPANTSRHYYKLCSTQDQMCPYLHMESDPCEDKAVTAHVFK